MIKYIERNNIIFQVDDDNPFRRFGPALLIAGTAMQVYGSIQQGQAAMGEAKSEQAIADYNAKVKEREAEQIEAKTKFDQSRQAEESARTMSTLQAGFGKSGAVVTEGSPLLIQAKQASELELENLMIGYEGATAAQYSRNEAKMYTQSGKLALQRGKNARTAAYIGAGSSLLQGFSSFGGTKGAGQTKDQQLATKHGIKY